MPAEENPYAAPMHVEPERLLAESDAGAWYDGRFLIVRANGAVLPPRCVKCNAPSDYWLRRRLAWHHPVIYVIFFLLGPLLYVVAALMARYKAVVDVGLCKMHRAQRRRRILVAWLIGILGLVVLVVASVQQSELAAGLVLVGLLMLVGAAIYGARSAATVSPHRIDRQFAWLKGASPQFLAELPGSPGLR